MPSRCSRLLAVRQYGGTAPTSARPRRKACSRRLQRCGEGSGEAHLIGDGERGPSGSTRGGLEFVTREDPAAVRPARGYQYLVRLVEIERRAADAATEALANPDEQTFVPIASTAERIAESDVATKAASGPCGHAARCGLPSWMRPESAWRPMILRAPLNSSQCADNLRCRHDYAVERAWLTAGLPAKKPPSSVHRGQQAGGQGRAGEGLHGCSGRTAGLAASTPIPGTRRGPRARDRCGRHSS